MLICKIRCIFIAILILIIVFCCFLFLPTQAIAENNNSMTDDWQECRDLEEVKTLVGFDGGEYILYEYLPNGYAIYTKNMVLIERNANAKSPYLGIYDNIIYNGPMSYYVDRTGYIYDLLTNEIVEVTSEVLEISRMLNETIEEPIVMTRGLSTDKGEIKNSEYIKNLFYDYNYFGTCGYISASILLGYYDQMFPNKNIIPKEYRLPDNQLSPKLHDDLRALGKKNETNADSLKPIVKKYLSNRGVTGISHYSWLGIFTTNTMLMDSINKNNPVILFATMKNPKDGKNMNHALVAYKYNMHLYTDTGHAYYYYTCHYGWSMQYNEVEINNNALEILVVQSYYLNVK